MNYIFTKLLTIPWIWIAHKRNLIRSRFSSLLASQCFLQQVIVSKKRSIGHWGLLEIVHTKNQLKWSQNEFWEYTYCFFIYSSSLSWSGRRVEFRNIDLGAIP